MTSINGSDNFNTIWTDIPPSPCTAKPIYSTSASTIYNVLKALPEYAQWTEAMRISGIHNYYGNPNAICTLFISPDFEYSSRGWVNFIDMIHSLTIKKTVPVQDIVLRRATYQTALKGSPLVISFPLLVDHGLAITGNSIVCSNGIIHFCVPADTSDFNQVTCTHY